MRKWMRERLQRRKKSPADTSGQPAPPPLQPAYFDADQQPEAAPDTAGTESEISAPVPVASEPRPPRRARASAPQPAAEDQSSETQSDAQADVQSPAPPRSVHGSSPARSRRRRGGRGRGGRGREQAVAQAFTPAAVKGSIPAVPFEPAEQEVGAEAEAEEGNEFPNAAQVQITPQITPPVRESAAPKAPVVPAAPPRPPKGIVVLAIGLPGSGKSSWFKRHNVVPLSSDMVRSLLFDDVREQRFQDLVFSNLRSMLKARLIAKRPMNYVDATNLTPQERQHWIKLAKDYQYEVHAVFFDVPLDVCLERHQRRDRVVPEDVMRRMAAKLKPPAFEEGFAKITVVRVKKKDPGSI
ncbi:MAG: AAA family ATPase [Candidatus Sulfotelmatobacter sp.]